VGRLTWPEGATCASREITRIRVMIISACLRYIVASLFFNDSSTPATAKTAVTSAVRRR
jgi:hypothetical protein